MFRSLVATLALGAGISALPVIENIDIRDVNAGASINSDFADPSLIQVGDTWYSFSTGAGAPRATSKDFTKWTRTDGQPLPKLGAWTLNPSDPTLWAPDVVQLSPNSFVMYYTAPASAQTYKFNKNGKPNQCVGAATASSIDGPWTAIDQVLACPGDKGGAIDASGFKDGDDQYVVYKTDGNSIGKPTIIMLQKMKADGTTPDGDPTPILQNDKNDSGNIEAPSLTKSGDTYFLFFSSAMWNTPQYDTSYAYSTAGIANGGKMYTKVKAPDAPLLKTGTFSGNQLTGPGGLSVATDGKHVAFHAYPPDTPAPGDPKAYRALYVGTINADAGAKKVTI